MRLRDKNRVFIAGYRILIYTTISYDEKYCAGYEQGNTYGSRCYTVFLFVCHLYALLL